MLARRLLEIGVLAEAPDNVRDFLMGKLATGQIMLVVVRGPQTCNCCDKPLLRLVVGVPKIRKGLEKLFKS